MLKGKKIVRRLKNEKRFEAVQRKEANRRLITIDLDPRFEKWIDSLSPEERDNEINNALRKGIKILSKLNPGIFGVTEIPMTLS